MTDALAIDTSVAIPLVVETHDDHLAVTAWMNDRPAVLCGHALAETYSVLTRLPDDARLAPADAAQLIAVRFGTPLILGARIARRLPAMLADLGLAGGAVYDALVALAAQEHDATLATRDLRARETYARVGARVEVAA